MGVGSECRTGRAGKACVTQHSGSPPLSRAIDCSVPKTGHYRCGLCLRAEQIPASVVWAKASHQGGHALMLLTRESPDSSPGSSKPGLLFLGSQPKGQVSRPTWLP